MSWNIQNLGITRIKPSVADPGRRRAVFILQTIAMVNPDILVVLEVKSGMPHPRATRGYVITANTGGMAVQIILSCLRKFQPAADWRLVPPLLSGTQGKKEGVAVFFKNSLVNFRGPQQITAGTLDNTDKLYQFAGDVVGGAKPPYQAPWDDSLPNTVPVGNPIGNPPRQQNQLCGKPLFDNPAHPGTPLGFPTVSDRSPFLTVFREVAGTNRTISVLACHLPPHTQPASQAITTIMGLPEIAQPLAADEVRVICGDLNVNFEDMANIATLARINLANIPRVGAAPTQYDLLHLITPSVYKKVSAANLDGHPTDFNVVSTGWDIANKRYRNPGTPQALDVIFAAFGANAAPVPAAALGDVLNRVVNTPYQPPPLPAGAIPEAMQMTIAEQLAYRATARPPLLTPDEVFRRMENYGKIRGASDHMPVYGDI
jgi:hypothetical protein